MQGPARAVTGHGERRHYRSGCRCAQCRTAHAAHCAAVRRARALRRALEAGPAMVSAEPAAVHLLYLQKLGVGVDQAARQARICPVTVRKVRSRARSTILASTAAAILGIRPVLAHGAIVPAWHTRRLLRALRSEGFTSEALAARLGRRRLAAGKSVTVRTALLVRRLYSVVTDDDPVNPSSEGA